MAKKVYKTIFCAEGRKWFCDRRLSLGLYTKKPRFYRQEAHFLISICGLYLKKIFPGIEKEMPKEKEYRRVEITMKFLD